MAWVQKHAAPSVALIVRHSIFVKSILLDFFPALASPFPVFQCHLVLGRLSELFLLNFIYKALLGILYLPFWHGQTIVIITLLTPPTDSELQFLIKKSNQLLLFPSVLIKFKANQHNLTQSITELGDAGGMSIYDKICINHSCKNMKSVSK